MVPFHSHSHSRAWQQGLSLLEVLVGLVIGLLTITVALGTLLISRQLAGTVHDAAQLQQQASHALRTLGQQVRQAGSLRLSPAFAGDSAQPVDVGDPVAFEITRELDPHQPTPSIQAVHGAAHAGARADGVALTLVHHNDTGHVTDSATAPLPLRDCLGQAPAGSLIRSVFSLHIAPGASSGELHCAGSHGLRQALIANVADFRVRFIQQGSTLAGHPTLQYHTAATVDAWPQVQAVEVCLEMEGSQRLPDTGTRYVNCANESVARGSRLRLVLRNVYQIRSQGLPH